MKSIYSTAMFLNEVSRFLSRTFASNVQYSLLTSTVPGPFNHVNGRRCPPSDSVEEINVLEPSSGRSLCRVPCSGEEDVETAVSTASNAYEKWRHLSNRDRGQVLLSVGKRIREKLEDISQLEVRNNGKPIWEARVDIASCADAFEYFGGVISSMTGQHIPLSNDSFAIVCREPLGVVAGIGAWNFPLQTCSWKVAPALACGNSMVFKPSPLTPLTAVVLAEIFQEVGAPEGVFNVIQGEAKTGHALCEHPSVAKISFTGSVKTGIQIMKTAAEGMKKLTLELGGKSPLIVFEDADITNAVKATLMANFLSQGAVCSNGTRVYVHENIAASFLEVLVKATQRLKIGNPHDATTTIGATISREHAQKVLGYIEEAKKDGAVVACGGKEINLSPPLDGGIYLSPCILTNCNDEMKAVREEIFGAVLTYMTFKSEDEVIARANKSEFGLAGAVFTRDLKRALRIVGKIQAGTVWINNYNIYPPELPFGGYKFSGFGRENGTAVLDHYTQLKSVYVESGDVDCGPLF